VRHRDERPVSSRSKPDGGTDSCQFPLIVDAGLAEVSNIGPMLASLGNSLAVPVARDDVATWPILGIGGWGLPRVELRPRLVIEFSEPSLILRGQSPEALRSEQLNDLCRDRVGSSFGALSLLSIV